MQPLALPLNERIKWLAADLAQHRAMALSGEISGKALSFHDLAERHPLKRPKSKSASFVGINKLAELGYCPGKAWHFGHGSAVIRSPELERSRRKGTEVHLELEKEEGEAAKDLPKATKKQLATPACNLVEIAEFPAGFVNKGVLYLGRIERVGRQDGNIVVREIKTARYPVAFDHMLQVWGYALCAPGALKPRGFSANGVAWSLDYPSLGRFFGPFPFLQSHYDALHVAMSCFQEMYDGNAPSSLDVIGSKCRPCVFASDCRWKATS